jgi:hypothetical protein
MLMWADKFLNQVLRNGFIRLFQLNQEMEQRYVIKFLFKENCSEEEIQTRQKTVYGAVCKLKGLSFLGCSVLSLVILTKKSLMHLELQKICIEAIPYLCVSQNLRDPRHRNCPIGRVCSTNRWRSEIIVVSEFVIQNPLFLLQDMTLFRRFLFFQMWVTADFLVGSGHRLKNA